MNDYSDPVTVLDDAACWKLLGSLTVGRVVTRVGEVVDIFPVNYVTDEKSIVLRTAEGSKYAEMIIGEEVLFEVDAYTDTEAWSVVVRGRARRIETEAEIAAAEALPLRPLVPTLKRNFVRIEAVSVSGRQFELGEEPPRDGVQPY
ncbi:pyridoxamine 5'-phosphate oxidase family protein [Leucobacter weissii]|uniref:Pyridoxamine 5'-phosphate oxidase family protein n=1 Tax=Leucobacter weissii TaxID=1983706 RepID=A0A939MPS9_9MICO|nr:pyridoxamine 5'-phosphate oxidase family protein [Leucobacter weissii]MBO1902376.1 pyridoxamine 5'-phosphate oxidase family protein [Leucobacter weissii]